MFHCDLLYDGLRIYAYICMILMVLFKLFSTPSLLNLIGFRYPSLIEYVVLLILFPHFRLGADPLNHAVVDDLSFCLSYSFDKWFFRVEISLDSRFVFILCFIPHLLFLLLLRLYDFV